MMARAGLVIDTQTLWDQIDGLAWHLERTYWALHGYILGADVVGADETWWRLMQAEGSKRWWAWSLTVPDAVWHGIAPSRSAATAKKYLEGFEGTLLVDGYNAYDTIAKEVGGIKLAHCWAHVRRKFFDAEKHYPACGSALDMIGELFELDRGTPDPAELDGDARPDAEQRRLSARREHGPPILERLPDVVARTTRSAEVLAPPGDRLHALVLEGAHGLPRRPRTCRSTTTAPSERCVGS